MSDHVGLDFNLVECFSVVHAYDGTNHLRDDGHVAKVGSHRLGLLARSFCGLPSFTKLLYQCHALPVQSTLESALIMYIYKINKNTSKVAVASRLRQPEQPEEQNRISPAALSCTKQLYKSFGFHIQQLIKIHATVGILPERALLRSVVSHGF
jgi:hypothetical protein